MKKVLWRLMVHVRAAPDTPRACRGFQQLAGNSNSAFLINPVDFFPGLAECRSALNKSLRTRLSSAACPINPYMCRKACVHVCKRFPRLPLDILLKLCGQFTASGLSAFTISQQFVRFRFARKRHLKPGAQQYSSDLSGILGV